MQLLCLTILLWIFKMSVYVATIGVIGWICFQFIRFVFPMIGQWIVNLNCRLQKRIVKLKAEEDQREIKQFEDDVEQIQKRHDDKQVIDGLYMTQDEINSTYDGLDL